MSANEAVARVREFVAKSPGVLVIKSLGPRGPQKLNMADLEAVLAELDDARKKLADPAVAAVVELLGQYHHEYRRAEAAHEAKDEANRRWLEATTGKEKAGG